MTQFIVPKKTKGLGINIAVYEKPRIKNYQYLCYILTKVSTKVSTYFGTENDINDNI